MVCSLLLVGNCFWLDFLRIFFQDLRGCLLLVKLALMGLLICISIIRNLEMLVFGMVYRRCFLLLGVC